MAEPKPRNNSRRSLYFNLGIVIAIISIFIFFQTQIDGRIESHPKVVGLEIKQDYTNRELTKINDKLEAIDEKLSKLLAEEYGP